MLKKEKTSIITFYSISPIHAGAGSSTSVVDLPIQRERHTNWPHIQASSVKGAMRQHFRRFAEKELNGKAANQYINYLFGSDDANDGSREKVTLKIEDNKKEAVPVAAGIISISDAKLFAFPMRSNHAPFVHITCPAVLKRLATDLQFCAIDNNQQSEHLNYSFLHEDEAIFLKGENKNSTKILLEDMVLNLKQNSNKEITVQLMKDFLYDLGNLLLVSDEVFNYCVSNCTEIQTQIKIDTESGTTQDGSLRYQELLPSDTLLYSVVYFSASAFDNNLHAEAVQNIIQENIKDFIQIGGDETMGRGICKINWY